MLYYDIKDILIELTDIGFSINTSMAGNRISVSIKYDVPNGDYDEFVSWIDCNSNAKSVLVGKGRLTDGSRVSNPECLGSFSYKYRVKEYTDRLMDYMSSCGYKMICVYSQRNGMRFSKHGQNINHICDYPYKLKFDFEKIAN